MHQPPSQPTPPPKQASTSELVRSRFWPWRMGVLLGLATIVLYWPATRHDFLNFDDRLYVTENVHTQSGLTLEGIKWAFVNPVAANWHPITMLSHMLDCQLFGLNPSGHHLTSVLLHALNAALVFVWLRGMTGAAWRSFFVAALFAVHPLRVESVAWIAERKDVLSTFFGLLSLIFYAGYARKRSNVPSPPSGPPAVPAPFSAVLDYALALLFLALGLMSKPMLVTWPCVMLLLDYWPLGRIAECRARNAEWESYRSLPRESWKSLVREKIPFFALALITGVLTFVVQKHVGAMPTAVDSSTLRARSGNALVSCCRYLAKMLWPAHLAIPYLHAGEWPVWQVLLAGAFILGISTLLFLQRRRHPFLLMGWLWYGGTLLPVIGLVQVGDQCMADRYTYIPSLGVLILTTWGTWELVRSWRYQAIALSAAGATALVLCAGLTRHQLGYWKDSETLFRHTVELAEDNYVAHNDLGVALDDQGRIDEAIRQFQTAVRLQPDYPDYHANLGSALFQKGQIDEAIRQYQEALGLKADNARTFYNLGTALYAKGRIDESIREFQEALRFKPDYAEAHSNLGSAYYKSGQINEAIRQFQQALRLKPDYAEIHDYLGVAFGTQGRIDEAIGQFQEAFRLKPDYTEARNNLAKTLEMKKASAGH